jgi:hypothetical protein
MMPRQPGSREGTTGTIRVTARSAHAAVPIPHLRKRITQDSSARTASLKNRAAMSLSADIPA